MREVYYSKGWTAVTIDILNVPLFQVIILNIPTLSSPLPTPTFPPIMYQYLNLYNDDVCF